MAGPVTSPTQREFRCNHCNGKILVPRELPPTTGPCPHCGGVITSPSDDPPEEPDAAFQIAAPLATAQPPEPSQTAAAGDAPAPAPAEKATPPPPPPEPPATAPVPVPAAISEKPKIDLPEKKPVSERNKPKKHSTPQSAKPHRSGLIPAMLVLLALFLLGGAAVYFASQELGKNTEPPITRTADGNPAANEANYIRVGWQKDAHQLLRNFMAAAAAKDKIPYVLNGKGLESQIEDFYGGGVIDDSDTPADAFSIYELSEEDRKRGIFMMIYDQPPQFDLKEFFRPLASLEVQYGVDEADLLLSTMSRGGNFAMEPLRVQAFFKRTAEGLKLDWEIFAQTKYRTFQNFVELPEINQTGVFRVFIVEDVPDKGRAVAGTRTYRLVDAANNTDSARVNVKVDSEAGRALSVINWRGTKENHPAVRNATIELKWTGETNAPELEISRFVCWEFLGLGGQATPVTASNK